MKIASKILSGVRETNKSVALDKNLLVSMASALSLCLALVLSGSTLALSLAPPRPLEKRVEDSQLIFVGKLVNRVQNDDWVQAELLVEAPLKNVKQGEKIPVPWRLVMVGGHRVTVSVEGNSEVVKTETVGAKPIFDKPEGARGIAILDDKHKGRYWLRADKFEELDQLETVRTLVGNTRKGTKRSERAAGKTAVATTAQANNAFAITLYQQIADENSGQNLFFSPYSISSALAMTIEGARGETATEMGNVLRYPESIRQPKDAARPWRTSLIHAGFQHLNKDLHSDPNDPEAAAVRKKIDILRDKLTEAKKATQAAKDARDWQKQRNLIAGEKKIADQLNDLLSRIDQFKLNVANALWAEKNYRIEEPYINTIATYYDTGALQSADFKNNFETERLRINGWVEDKTKERIKDLIPAGALDRLTRLVLVNAIYFNGDWATPFDEGKTRDLAFNLANRGTTQAKTMQAFNLEGGRYGAFQANGEFFHTPLMISRDKETAMYPDEDGFAIAELPYKGGDLSMVLIAPLSANGLPRIEKQLNNENLNTWLGRLKQRKMHVTLPKFKLETNYTLGDSNKASTLQKMGMVRAFTDPRHPNGADFTGMHDTDVRQDRLYISMVLHKAFLDVNEKGTEAAAATAVIMPQPESAPIRMPFTPAFNADRPFILMIRHNPTGVILFMGRVMNPTEASS